MWAGRMPRATNSRIGTTQSVARGSGRPVDRRRGLVAGRVYTIGDPSRPPSRRSPGDRDVRTSGCGRGEGKVRPSCFHHASEGRNSYVAVPVDDLADPAWRDTHRRGDVSTRDATQGDRLLHERPDGVDQCCCRQTRPLQVARRRLRAVMCTRRRATPGRRSRNSDALPGGPQSRGDGDRGVARLDDPAERRDTNVSVAAEHLRDPSRGDTHDSGDFLPEHGAGPDEFVHQRAHRIDQACGSEGRVLDGVGSGALSLMPHRVSRPLVRL